jgi:hypothetical protein
MKSQIDVERFKAISKLKGRYSKQLQRIQNDGKSTAGVEEAVENAITNLATTKNSSLVIYGEPQSGKTEMMICLTARLLDEGHKIIIHLVNDSLDLLAQNLKRFKASGLAPAPRNSSELIKSTGGQGPQELVVFCKKNASDLKKLVDHLQDMGQVVVVDDEADYATPNAKINQGTKTAINDLVGQLIGTNGFYLGVTATPARLDLNNTFQNDSENWVNFPPHPEYTGQDTFFPLKGKVPYRLTLLPHGGSPKEARDALVRFFVTVAYLNLKVNHDEQNYSMLVHTSGRTQAHEDDRVTIEDSVRALIDSDGSDFSELVTQVYETAQTLYPSVDPNLITDYVVANASRATLVVLNNERDRVAAGDNPTNPSSPFTIIIGGNIVSRGVTFPNLLSMFFTRGVLHRLQQDTYIQRARMFGARNEYLEHFELTIPEQLYSDWHRCFIFHRLALDTVKSTLGSPVWIGDRRIGVASKPSIDKATVVLDKGEMSFGMFAYSADLDAVILEDQSSVETLRKLRDQIGDDAIPKFLIEYIETVAPNGPRSLAIHTASSIAGYGDTANQSSISRDKGFLGNPQLEEKKCPEAVHHIKILYNAEGRAKLFYKFKGSLQFVQNLRKAIS